MLRNLAVASLLVLTLGTPRAAAQEEQEESEESEETSANESTISDGGQSQGSRGIQGGVQSTPVKPGTFRGGARPRSGGAVSPVPQAPSDDIAPGAVGRLAPSGDLPASDGFGLLIAGEIPGYKGTDHYPIYLGGGQKWAVKFAGRPLSAPIVIFGATTIPELIGPMVMYVSVSRKKGDFKVSPGCLVTPAEMHIPGANGGVVNGAKIQIIWKTSIVPPDIQSQANQGLICLLEPNGIYYLNVAGDCAPIAYERPDRYPFVKLGCPATLVNANGFPDAFHP